MSVKSDLEELILSDFFDGNIFLVSLNVLYFIPICFVFIVLLFRFCLVNRT